MKLPRATKHQLHHYYRYVQPIQPRYLLLAAGVSSVTCVLALRANNEHMATLREAVYAADKDNGDVQAALGELQLYVTSHMNTSLSSGSAAVYPPIQLQYTYQRLVAQQGSALQASNSAIYSDAQAYCQAQNSTSVLGRDRVPCIEQYVSERTLQTTKLVDDSLYKFDFVAAKWSPDLAGCTMVLTFILLIAAVVKLFVDRWFRHHA